MLNGTAPLPETRWILIGPASLIRNLIHGGLRLYHDFVKGSGLTRLLAEQLTTADLLSQASNATRGIPSSCPYDSVRFFSVWSSVDGFLPARLSARVD
jgi:hypothetical protein